MRSRPAFSWPGRRALGVIEDVEGYEGYVIAESGSVAMTALFR